MRRRPDGTVKLCSFHSLNPNPLDHAHGQQIGIANARRGRHPGAKRAISHNKRLHASRSGPTCRDGVCVCVCTGELAPSATHQWPGIICSTWNGMYGVPVHMYMYEQPVGPRSFKQTPLCASIYSRHFNFVVVPIDISFPLAWTFLVSRSEFTSSYSLSISLSLTPHSFSGYSTNQIGGLSERERLSLEEIPNNFSSQIQSRLIAVILCHFSPILTSPISLKRCPCNEIKRWIPRGSAHVPSTATFQK
jgi:hypothetical protein